MQAEMVLAGMVATHGPATMSGFLALVATGLVVGGLIGATGAGGGALLTPLLVTVFGLPPLTAVGSDLGVSLLVKPVAGMWHLRRGTTRLDIAGWVTAGSVPGAVGGVLLARSARIGSPHRVDVAIGAVLLLSALASLWRTLRSRRELANVSGVWAESRAGSRTPALGHGSPGAARPPARPLATAVLGAVGGILVGLTSVGSGALLLAGLALLYPTLAPADLVGTDLVQAVPMVAAAAFAHLATGDVDLSVTGALLLGALPGTIVGAQLSARCTPRFLRPAIVVLLAATGAWLLV